MGKKGKGGSGVGGAPEAPGKKGKKSLRDTGGNADSEEQQKDKLTEVDKEWYQIQIRTLEEKLDRRNERMLELERSNLDYQERYDVLREDKADVVAYLKRTLQQRTDQIAELQARLEGLQQVHQTDGRNYEHRLKVLDQEFAKTKEQLASENMVLNKKLDALEEFRIQREQLMSRFEEQEAKYETQKSEYEEQLYELEKKHIIEEDRLKNDMMEKLNSVASEFRKASHAQMSATTQRTIRENINVSAQVVQLSEKAAELVFENDRLQEENKDKARKIELLEMEQDHLVKKSAYRAKLIKELIARTQEQEGQIKTLGKYQQERAQHQVKVDSLRGEIANLNTRLGTTSALTKEKEAAISDMNKKLRGVSKTKDIINVCLNEANISIRAALALQGESGKSDDDAKMQREGILNQLLVLLNTAAAESKQQQQRGDEDDEDDDDDDDGAAREMLAMGRRRASSSTSRRKFVKGEPRQDSIEYIMGSLGLVPKAKDDADPAGPPPR